jgi:hypothetical protein
MVNPYLTGTCTLQDMPSFAWRTHPTINWKIHRIWSTDWFKHREAEIERLLKTLSASSEGAKTEMAQIESKF